jgi:hypothetical protein
MPFFTSAIELLNDGETGLFLFTDGRFFLINAEKTGSSGIWNINPKRKIDRVVIFRWASDQNGERFVELFSALPDGFDGMTGQYTVLLREINYVGNTISTWEEFVGTQQNPGRLTTPQYITRSATG